MTNQAWNASGSILLAITIIVSAVGFKTNLNRTPLASGSLLRRDTLTIPIEQQASHLQYLTSIVQQGGAAQIALQIHREDVRSQTRNIYVVIVVALISFVFSKGISERGISLSIWIKDIGAFNDLVCGLAIVVCLLMYGLDVHINDLVERDSQINQFGTNAFLDIVRIQPTDFRYYTLDYSQADSTQKATAEVGNRIPREFTRALQPNIEQIAFYMLPLALLSVFWMRSRAKK